ncbi:hypothetical protein [Paenibacillus macerans]|nr:hypothetical protein [Paenibacillus macerans]
MDKDGYGWLWMVMDGYGWMKTVKSVRPVKAGKALALLQTSDI